MVNTREESDFIGKKQIPATALWGIHTARAVENFSISGQLVHPELIKAYGEVKLACAQTNNALDFWEDKTKAEAIEKVAFEMSQGLLNKHILVDALQGGAGTSTNMNVNEVLANRALQILGKELGDYKAVSPLDDINLHQSTNDTYPTALKVAAIRLLRELEQQVLNLQEAFQQKEKEFAHIVKIGRTQLQDAVLTTLGREMSAYAEALNRDRWRIYKCEERLRVVNLGGTAIGTGLGAPKQFIFRVVDKLRENTNIGLARSENLIDGTQNADVFVEVSGILKACAVNLLKISNDLRLLSSGPHAGLGEINLPQLQAGSSIMPGKVNPVIPEAVVQAAMKVMGNDQVIAQACGAGNLELNPFMPLIANSLLESIDLLKNASKLFNEKCVSYVTANADVCRMRVHNSTATITALVPKIGYERCSEIVKMVENSGLSIKEAALKSGHLTACEFDELITPEAVCRLGN
ncbi:aspartate ammonia-lyase [Draconibacterium orientale]|jgi:aspartate ammonia-lyase|uniref:Aspartate ammonia-lyase n=1 Tax=Draconibacterium orientale TaxID=1168034 RepID=A0A1I0GUA3_9BACT|nr:aspartate ammonia-lyase [Draconibacterium orientale]SET73849.1 aspartate ammonia-lyase [Draconibacterium orientale]